MEREIVVKDCKYRLPCNWCDKYDRMCEAVLLEIYIQEQEKNKCEHNWQFIQEYWDSESKKIFNKYGCTKCGDTEYRVNCFQPNT